MLEDSVESSRVVLGSMKLWYVSTVGRHSKTGDDGADSISKAYSCLHSARAVS